MSEQGPIDITTLTVELLSAFVSHNSVPAEGLAELILTTRAALSADPTADAADAPAMTYTPAVSVRKSLSSPEHIISMIDGRPYKTLKRHLTTHGLTPDEYRQRYDLPKSYPLVAPSYSEARRAVANRLGLGRRPAGEAKASEKPVGKGKRSAPSPRMETVAADNATPSKPSAKAKAHKLKSAKASPPARQPKTKAPSSPAEPAA